MLKLDTSQNSFSIWNFLFSPIWDPIKFLKLLDMFGSLNNLKLDFNRLFGVEDCIEIQNQQGISSKGFLRACEIFGQLPLQVELRRRSSWYCNQLLGDDYRSNLTEVLVTHQRWEKEKYQEDLMKEIGLNLNGWSKAYEDISMSYLFMMNNHFHFCILKGTKLGIWWEILG